MRYEQRSGCAGRHRHNLALPERSGDVTRHIGDNGRRLGNARAACFLRPATVGS
ncbi:hypothetical protein [Streptomyces cavernae]|uniref:hypothetical protein n=1 Tax=Streptomyces cavernae TaxID=2259034 RepID=UPI001EE3F3FF|nr:hypothetical protein [Streptomyces cavernae]